MASDSILNRIAFSAIKHTSKRAFSDRRKWKKETRSFEYALKLSGSDYKMLETFRFEVDLLDFISSSRFYYDRRIKTSDLDLYAGRPEKIRNSDHEDYVEPVPLKSKTEDAVMEQMFSQWVSNRGWKESTSRAYSRIGVACRLETRSLNRSKRPFMYVIVVLAGKQNMLLKKKDKTERILRYEVD